MYKKIILVAGAVALLCTFQAFSQGATEDYKRADEIRELYSDKAYFDKVNVNWIDSSNQLWYTVNTPKGIEYFLVDAEKGMRKSAFNQEKLAASLSEALNKEIIAYNLPIRNLAFIEEGKSISFSAERKTMQCDLKKFKFSKIEDIPERNRNRGYWGQDRDELSGDPMVSPDSLWEAFIRDFDVYLRNRNNKSEIRLSWDGSEGEYYSSYMYWSPDSKKLLANKFTPGYSRKVHYIESSPKDQVQPKHSEIQYTKPGDKLPHLKPTLFLVTEEKQINISDALYPEQFSLGRFTWREDSRGVSFEYNQRGHQLYRVIEVNAKTGKPRVLVNEACETFFHYSEKRFRHDLDDGMEIIWASERDGWNHLYLINGETGEVKSQITKGN